MRLLDSATAIAELLLPVSASPARRWRSPLVEDDIRIGHRKTRNRQELFQAAAPRRVPMRLPPSASLNALSAMRRTIRSHKIVRMLSALAQGINRIRNGGYRRSCGAVWPPANGRAPINASPVRSGATASPRVVKGRIATPRRRHALRAVHPPPLGTPPVSTDLPWQRGLHVLVIDDLALHVKLLPRRWSRLAYVQTAESGEEGRS